MPKVGMEPVRKKQLIEATLEVMTEVGYHGTTISLISKKAGLSSGIVSHYFGDKQGLIEATMRHLLAHHQTIQSQLSVTQSMMRSVVAIERRC